MMRDQGEAVGKADGTIPANQTKRLPDGHPTGEHAVRREGNRARASVLNVLMACGKKLKEVNAAAM